MPSKRKCSQCHIKNVMIARLKEDLKTINKHNRKNRGIIRNTIAKYKNISIPIDVLAEFQVAEKVTDIAFELAYLNTEIGDLQSENQELSEVVRRQENRINSLVNTNASLVASDPKTLELLKLENERMNDLFTGSKFDHIEEIDELKQKLINAEASAQSYRSKLKSERKIRDELTDEKISINKRLAEANSLVEGCKNLMQKREEKYIEQIAILKDTHVRETSHLKQQLHDKSADWWQRKRLIEPTDGWDQEISIDQ